ncbi:MAG: hypothetical protein HY525_09100 [Betaproteobacteria bacterium]|nr:hypothetical protein [Betaproteobacteria bacterium]
MLDRRENLAQVGGCHDARPIPLFDGARELICRPHKRRDSAGARTPIQLAWGTDLDDLAVVEHGNAVTDRHGFDLIVGDVHCREAKLPLKRDQLVAQLLAHARVDVRQRLVEQDDAAAADNRPRQRHALLLAAAQLGRMAPLQCPAPNERGAFVTRARKSSPPMPHARSG